MAEWHDTTEEYLEAILEIEEEGTIPIRARLVERLGLSAPAVSETVEPPRRPRLRRADGRPQPPAHHKGREVATSIVRRHRLAERLLVDIIGLEWEKVHKEADRWEHAISADVEEKLVLLLGDPATCPHGNPIPGSGHKVEGPASVPLTQMQPGPVIVRRISEKVEIDDDAIAFLAGAELIPGSDAVVVSTSTEGVQLTERGGRADRPPQARPARLRRPRLTEPFRRQSCGIRPQLRRMFVLGVGCASRRRRRGRCSRSAPSFDRRCRRRRGSGCPRRRRTRSRSDAARPARRRAAPANPGCAASRPSSTSATVPPSALTSASPPESSRSWVGMRTVTAMTHFSSWSGGNASWNASSVGGDHGRGADGRLDRVERLEAVAGDVGDDALVGPDDALGGEPLQRRDGDAARGLGEDALGAGEQLHRRRRSRRR